LPQPAASENQANLIALFSEAVIAFYPEVRAGPAPFFSPPSDIDQVKIPVDDESALLVQLLDWGIRHAKTGIQGECAWHIVAAIVNKRTAGNEQLFSVVCGPTNALAKTSTLFSTPLSPRFGIRRLLGNLTLMRGVVLFQHGPGYGSNC